MDSRLAVVIPWLDRGDPDRRRDFEFVLDYYRSLGLGEVVLGSYEDDGGPFNRAKCINDGVRRVREQFPDVTHVLLCDADALMTKESILAAFQKSINTGHAVLPYDKWPDKLTREETNQIFGGRSFTDFASKDLHSYPTDGSIRFDWLVGPAFIVPLEVFDKLDGFDEGYIGWGEEEKDFLQAHQLFIGNVEWVDGIVYNLYHPPVSDNAMTAGTEANKLWTANHRRREAKVAYLRTIEEWRTRQPVWFSSDYMSALLELARKPDTRILQIGVYTGDASVWICSNILGPGSTLVDVDTWEGSTDEDAHSFLDWKQVKARYDQRVDGLPVETFAGTSDEFFAGDDRKFDAIYIDGSHETDQVWKDLVNAHDRLKVGGILGLDDYGWFRNGKPVNTPKTAIDRFMMSPAGRCYEVISVGWQVWLRKATDTPAPDAGTPAGPWKLSIDDMYDKALRSMRSGEWDAARRMFVKYLAAPEATDSWRRSEACRGMVRMVWPQFRESWLLKACSEDPSRREVWADLAQWYADQGMPREAAGAASRALRITERPPGAGEDQAWDDVWLKILSLQQ